MEPEPHKPPLRFYEIDLLRFLAAIAVVFYHYAYVGYHLGNLSPIRYERLEPVAKYGYLGVELFFVISGYVVLMSSYNKTLKQFFLSRLTRLFPAFWVACTLAFLAVRFFGPSPGSPAAGIHLMHVSLREYIVNLTMLQEFVGVDNLDGPYWTLTKELAFYFLISLVLGYRLFKSLDVVLLLWLAYTAVTGPAPAQHAPFFYLFIPDFSAFFVAGMVFFLWQNKLLPNWKLYGLLLLSFLLCLRSARAEASAYADLFHESFSPLVASSVVTLIFGVFWLVITRRLNLQRYRWLAWAGALTYPLYLLHADLGFLLFQHLGGLFNRYVLLAVIVGLMLIGSYLLHVLIEKRFARPLGQQANRLLTFFSH